MPLFHDFVPLDHRFDVVARVLIAADEAELARRLDGSGPAGIALVEVGGPRFHEEILVIPVRVSGDGAPFDTLDADLRLEPVEPERTHLSLTGSYEALFVSGREARVRQRLVESWVRAYLQRVSTAIGVAEHQPVTR